MGKYICVYSSSSCALEKKYYTAAHKLGQYMVEKGYNLIFGGGQVGLMGIMAEAVHNSGGKVIGIIPERLNKEGIVYEKCYELIVTKNLRDRKASMDEMAAGFIAMPGGFGTLEELLEIITLKQLRYHNRPVVILNIEGFYDGLIKVFDKIIEEKFAREASRHLFFVAQTIEEAVNYIEEYIPEEFSEKWLTHVAEEEEVQK